MKELWKEVNGFPEYAVSNTGFVKRIKQFSNGKQQNKVGCLIAFRPGGSNKQYHRVSFNRDGKGYDRYVHRLVLEHFDSPCPPGWQASHLDGNPHNNHISNLRWESPKQNSQRKIMHGTSGKGEKNTRAKLNPTIVHKIIEMYINGISLEDISLKLNTTIGNTRVIAHRRGWKHIDIGPEKENMIKIEKRFRLEESWRKNAFKRT